MKNHTIAIITALTLAGCAAPHQFSAPATGWKSRTGQLRYERGSRSVIGELTLSTAGEHTKLEFSKGPGLTLLQLQMDGTHGRAEGPMAPGTREFALAKPGRFAGWAGIPLKARSASAFQFASGPEKFDIRLAP